TLSSSRGTGKDGTGPRVLTHPAPAASTRTAAHTGRAGLIQPSVVIPSLLSSVTGHRARTPIHVPGPGYSRPAGRNQPGPAVRSGGAGGGVGEVGRGRAPGGMANRPGRLDNRRGRPKDCDWPCRPPRRTEDESMPLLPAEPCLYPDT